MSLPAGGLVVTTVPSGLVAPDSLVRSPLTLDYELGGVAVGDTSQGLSSTTWRARVVGSEARLSAAPYTTETVLITVAGITEVSLAFNQSMAPHLAYVSAGVAKLWWFDTAVSAMATMVMASDVRSPFLTLDDKRSIAGASNDILMFYLKGNSLYYRQQRDRFQTEYLLKAFTITVAGINKVGMSTGIRLHVEIGLPYTARGA